MATQEKAHTHTFHISLMLTPSVWSTGVVEPFCGSPTTQRRMPGLDRITTTSISCSTIESSSSLRVCDGSLRAYAYAWV